MALRLETIALETSMRRILLLTSAVAVAVAASMPAASAPRTKAQATALDDCYRQARAMQFGRRNIQRRNFIKDCMVDKGFPGQVN